MAKKFQVAVTMDEYGAVVDATGKTLREASVAEYFHAKLGKWIDDPQTKTGKEPYSPYSPEFHIQTVCGEHCKVVIDFAKRVMTDATDDLSPSHEQNVRALIKVTEDTVLEFVYG